MADTKLPEGTDSIIEGAGSGGGTGGTGRSGTTRQGGGTSSAGNSSGARTGTTDSASGTDALISGSGSTGGSSTGSSSLGGGGAGSSTGSSSLGGAGAGSSTGSSSLGGGAAGSTSGSVGSTGGLGSTGGTSGATGSGSSGTTPTGSTSSDSSSSDQDGGSSKSGVRGLISSAGTKARDEAANRARGFVGQGLTSSSATLGNIAGIIEDTVEQIGERLGPQYADYARSASQTVSRYASTLENKDPDELVDDAREIIRKSPGVALAGAAIVGFGLVRLLKAGIEEGQNGTGNRTSGRAS